MLDIKVLVAVYLLVSSPYSDPYIIPLPIKSIF